MATAKRDVAALEPNQQNPNELFLLQICKNKNNNNDPNDQENVEYH